MVLSFLQVKVHKRVALNAKCLKRRQLYPVIYYIHKYKINNYIILRAYVNTNKLLLLA